VADLGFEKGGFKVGEVHVRTRCAAVGLTLTWYVRTRTRSVSRGLLYGYVCFWIRPWYRLRVGQS